MFYRAHASLRAGIRPCAPAMLLATLLLAGCATPVPDRAPSANQTPQTKDPYAASARAALTRDDPAPSVIAPSVAAPSVAAPSMIAPAATAPAATAPSVAAPSVAAPSVGPANAAEAGPALAPQRPSDLLDRMRQGFGMPDLPQAVIAPYLKRFASKPDFLNRVLERGGPYLFHIVEEVEARRLPMELALLPIVESAFNPQATSRAKAAGLWQFIPSTGRDFDLSQNWWTDERRDVIESTRAALDYLQRIYALRGNDWFLALASYNWGEGSVGRSMSRNQAKGLKTDYLSLKMPRETRSYVPQLIALREIVKDPARYGLSLPLLENRPHFVAIDKTTSIDRDLAASLAGLSMETFRTLNPHLRRPVITVSRTSRIILPVGSADTYLRNLEAHTASGLPLVSWRPYTFQQGDSLAKLASARGITAKELAEANGLKSERSKLMPGSSILLPIRLGERPAHQAGLESQLARFDGAKTVKQVTIPAQTYRVKKRDTLQTIARRFGLSVETLRRLNRIEGEVKAGMRLIIKPARRSTITERVAAD